MNVCVPFSEWRFGYIVHVLNCFPSFRSMIPLFGSSGPLLLAQRPSCHVHHCAPKLSVLDEMEWVPWAGVFGIVAHLFVSHANIVHYLNSRRRSFPKSMLNSYCRLNLDFCRLGPHLHCQSPKGQPRSWHINDVSALTMQISESDMPTSIFISF